VTGFVWILALTDDFAYYDDRETKLIAVKEQQRIQAQHNQTAQATSSSSSSSSNTKKSNNDDDDDDDNQKVF
jgi:hypothetical protein